MLKIMLESEAKFWKDKGWFGIGGEVIRIPRIGVGINPNGIPFIEPRWVDGSPIEVPQTNAMPVMVMP
jgi:hypothetical protein